MASLLAREIGTDSTSKAIIRSVLILPTIVCIVQGFPFSVGGRFKLVKAIREGKTGEVCQIQDDAAHGNQMCAMKIQQRGATKGDITTDVAVLRDISKFEALFPKLIYPDPAVKIGPAIGQVVAENVPYDFYAMSLVGPDMVSLIIWSSKDKENITLRQAVRWFLQVETVLRQLHAAGWAHNDLAPVNFCVDPEHTNKVILIDFADSKKFDPEASISTVIKNENKPKGPYGDYVNLMYWAAQTMVVGYREDPVMKARFPGITKKKLMLTAMYEQQKKSLPAAGTVYENLQKMQEDVGQKFRDYFTKGINDMPPFIADWKSETTPITQWKKGDPIALLSYEEAKPYGK